MYTKLTIAQLNKLRIKLISEYAPLFYKETGRKFEFVLTAYKQTEKGTEMEGQIEVVTAEGITFQAKMLIANNVTAGEELEYTNETLMQTVDSDAIFVTYADEEFNRYLEKNYFAGLEKMICELPGEHTKDWLKAINYTAFDELESHEQLIPQTERLITLVNQNQLAPDELVISYNSTGKFIGISYAKNRYGGIELYFILTAIYHMIFIDN